MDVIMKTFLGVFFSLVIVFLGFNVNAAAVRAHAADSFAADCVTKIENAHYAPEVIAACKQDAANNGFDLKIDTYGPMGSNQVTYGFLQLGYEYAIPMLHSSKKHYVYADIR